MSLRLTKLGALVAIVAIVGLFSVYVGAQEDDQTNPITLAITPQLLDITANPGEKITNTFRLSNGSDQNLQIETTPKNFLPRGEEGAVNLTEDNTTYAIATWTSVSPQTSEMPAKTTKDFEVTIDVPADAEPGSHFGSVVFQTIPPESDTAAALISQEIAPVILVRIAGDVVESAEIAEFKTNTSFYSNENTVEFISRLENTGNVHFKPTGQIIIKNMFGQEVEKINLKEENVLPDSIRQITSEWTDYGFQVGRFTAELTVVSGEDNQIVTSKTSFVIFPYQTIIPIVALIIIFVFILYKGRSRIKLAFRALSGKDTNTKEK